MQMVALVGTGHFFIFKKELHNIFVKNVASYLEHDSTCRTKPHFTALFVNKCLFVNGINIYVYIYSLKFDN